MANLIDSLSKNKSLVSETPLKNEKEIVKEGPSFFDSLLKDSSEESLKTDSKISTNKEEPKNTTVVKEELKTEVSIENDESVKTEESKVDVKSENKNSQGSLLDRLVIEAKKESETPKVNVLMGEIKEEIKVVEDTLLNNVGKEDPKNIPEVKIEVTSENDESVKTEESKVDVKSENKNTQGSLLDRLVIEAKKEAETPKVNVLMAEIKEETKVIEDTLLNNVGKEELKNTIEVKKEVLLENVKGNINSIQTDSSAVFVEDINTMDKNDTSVVENNTSVNTKQEGALSNLLVQDSISSEESLIDENKPKEKRSLMDLLILKNSQKTLLNENGELVKNQSSSNEFISNMYLSSQKNGLNNQLLFNKKEAMTLLQEGQTIQNIEKSADLLDLGLENIDVEQTLGSGKKLDIKQQDLDILNKKSILDKLFIEKNIKNDDLKGIITQSVEASKALMENTLNIQDDVSVNVNSPLSYNIQSRIIGAKQQMSMMMSDIARQMYENYKPPVTVFKINLNPLELGNISILMKNDRNNGLNISMNVSNMTTLDALIENQNLLKNSLTKSFDENTAFNLDFNSSNQGNSQSQNPQNNEERRFGREHVDTQTLLQLKEENKDREDNLDYM